MTFSFVFITIINPMKVKTAHYKIILFFLFAVLPRQPVFCDAGELDDQLRLIKGSYDDGVLDLAESEARDFLEKAGNHRARGEVNLILGYIEQAKGNPGRAGEFFLKATGSDDPAIRLQGYYEAAAIDWSSGRYARAAENYRLIVDENRGGTLSDVSRYWLVLSLYRAGDYSGTAEMVTSIENSGAVMGGEQWIQALYCRGMAYYRLNRSAESAKDLESVFLSDTQEISADAALMLAKIHVQLRDFRLADTWAARRLDYGFNREAMIIRSSAAYESGDLHGMIGCLKRILEDETLEPVDRSRIMFRKAVCEARIKAVIGGDWWSPLISLFEGTHPIESDTYLFDEIESLGSGRSMPDEFPLIMDTAVSWNPHSHGLQMANLYISSGDPDRAAYWLTRYFIESGDVLPDSRHRLIMARLLSAMGEKDSAAIELEAIDLSLSPGERNLATMQQQADLMLQSGLYQQAASMYQEIMLDPGVTEPERQSAMFRLGDAYLQMENWELSIEVFSRFLEAFPQVPLNEKEAAMRKLALSCIKNSSWLQAETTVSSYFQQIPETEFAGELYYLKGMAQANQGKLEEAQQSLGRALDILGESEFVETVKESIRIITEKQKNAGNE